MSRSPQEIWLGSLRPLPMLHLVRSRILPARFASWLRALDIEPEPGYLSSWTSSDLGERLQGREEYASDLLREALGNPWEDASGLATPLSPCCLKEWVPNKAASRLECPCGRPCAWGLGRPLPAHLRGLILDIGDRNLGLMPVLRDGLDDGDIDLPWPVARHLAGYDVCCTCYGDGPDLSCLHCKNTGLLPLAQHADCCWALAWLLGEDDDHERA